MSTELTTLLGIIGAVATMLAVLLPVIRAQGTSLRREITAQGESLRREIDAQAKKIDEQGESLRREISEQGVGLRREIDALRGDVAELRRDVHDLSDRVSRIEGLLSIPARTTNGAPAPAGEEELEANE
jgi:chromosome segregation ATPase